MFKVLFLCTGNSCRSQMAEGLVNHYLAGKVKAFSAGVKPSQVNPKAIQVMAEIGIDISGHWSKAVEELAGEQFDLVITVCDQAKEQCPFFPGPTLKMHVSFPDPAQAAGSDQEVIQVFRRVREAIREKILPILNEQANQKTA